MAMRSLTCRSLARAAHRIECSHCYSLAALSLLLVLFIASCSGPPAQLGGNYSGYVGVQTDNNKIGLSAVIEQKGDILSGTAKATMIGKDGTGLELEGRVYGTVKGNSMEMQIHFDGGLQLSMKGEFKTDGGQGPRMFGTSKVINSSETMPGRPWVLKKT